MRVKHARQKNGCIKAASGSGAAEGIEATIPICKAFLRARHAYKTRVNPKVVFIDEMILLSTLYHDKLDPIYLRRIISLPKEVRPALKSYSRHNLSTLKEYSKGDQSLEPRSAGAITAREAFAKY